MNDQKLENLLNLSMDATPEEREKSLELDVGYEQEGRLWDVIVKYSGNLDEVRTLSQAVVPLLNEYAVVTISQENLQRLSELPRIEYIEKPKRLFFAVNQGRAASCVNELYNPPYNLRGEGVLVGLIDSGVDYLHPDFIRPASGEDSGSGMTDIGENSRILRLWDQSVAGNPPVGYAMGSEYTQQQIDAAIRAAVNGGRQAAYGIVPSRDLSGHGTEVLGIAAGNGRASDGVNRGMAPDSEIIAVKLGNSRADSFPRTTELMQGIDYLVRTSIAYNRSMAINISFGNNYGSHTGDSLLTTYLDAVSSLGRTVICVGSGNEGASGVHTSGVLTEGAPVSVELAVSSYQTSMNLQLWKAYVDQFDIYLRHPSGAQVGPLYEQLGAQRYQLGTTTLLLYYGKPAPYSLSQEIYFDFIPVGNYVDPGIWTVTLSPHRIVEGRYDMWLPGGGTLNAGTGFLLPNPSITLTIPGTASKVITVGAYDSRRLSYADFSGRGYTCVTNHVKPDLVAPGVAITTTSTDGGYTTVTGTSFATPFVTGAAALLMEWGIVRGNDPFLYGEKVKAYLRRGARPLPGFTEYPNPQVGYGALCVNDALP